MKYKLQEFRVKNYRSITDIKFTVGIDNLSVICGSNNVGKTNFLRALSLFFQPELENFDAERDIPYHIAEGSRGAGYKTSISAKFINLDTSEIYLIEQNFSERKGVKEIVLTGKRDQIDLNSNDVKNFIYEHFRFFFIEASNVDIPQLVSEIVNDEILPLGMDRRRGQTQKDSLAKLNQFIDLSKEAVSSIEKELTNIFQGLLNKVDSIDSKDWKLQINFPEYDFLREAISKIIDFTLFDTNERKLETKGSGIQRIILLSLIQYVNTKTKKDVIWAIDEPEIFLQAGLQKSLYSKIVEESKDRQIFITTHSHFFIDINHLDNTFLFEGTKELKNYARKPDTYFYKLNTLIFQGSAFEKAQKIKENFGIGRNDTWEVMPYNILVEGQEDKDILIALIKKFDLPTPNILVAGGVTKYPGYIRFLEDLCSDLEYKPIIVAIHDRDGEGRNIFNSIKDKHYEGIKLTPKFITRYDGATNNDIELEDYIYPDILFDAANKILRRKKYKIIKKSDRTNRHSKAYDKKPVLEFLTEVCRQNNPDKNSLDFNKQGMKLMLTKECCKLIDGMSDINELDMQYPNAKFYLEEILKIGGMN